jgi:hypothetical protein
VASTRVPAEFRVFIWGTVAAGIAALLAPALAAASNFYRPTPLRRSRSDSTALLEIRRRPNTRARRRFLLGPGRQPLSRTRSEHSYALVNRTARIVAFRQGAN